MATLSSRSSDDLAKLFMLRRETITSDVLLEFHRQAQILNRYVIAEFLFGDPTVGSLRKEIRRLFNGLKTTDEELRTLLSEQVIKRDTLDGDAPKAAKSTVKRAVNAAAKKAAKGDTA